MSDGSYTSANETALTVALMKYMKAHNKEVSNLSVMGFGGSCHGGSITTLSCSDP